MNRGYPRQTLIVSVQRRSHSRQAGHQPVDRRLAVIGAFQQPLDFAASADNEVAVAAFDQGRAAEQQAIVGAGEPEILRHCVAQTPHLVHGFCPVFVLLVMTRRRSAFFARWRRSWINSARNGDAAQATNFVIASEAKQSSRWIASSLSLLAMTGMPEKIMAGFRPA
jgi:hypothetical protein